MTQELSFDRRLNISALRITGNSFFINNETSDSSITDMQPSARPSDMLLYVTNNNAIACDLDERA